MILRRLRKPIAKRKHICKQDYTTLEQNYCDNVKVSLTDRYDDKDYETRRPTLDKSKASLEDEELYIV